MSGSAARMPGATAGRPGAEGARPAGPLRWALRLLLAGPGQMRPWGCLAAYALTAAGAVMLVWSGAIHLRLWSAGYSSIPVIGPLFLAQGMGTIVIAAALVIIPRLVLMVVGAVTLGATAVGLLLSVHTGLLGYRESLAVPYARSSLVVEFAGAAILVFAAGVVASAAHGRQEPGR